MTERDPDAPDQEVIDEWTEPHAVTERFVMVEVEPQGRRSTTHRVRVTGAGDVFVFYASGTVWKAQGDAHARIAAWYYEMDRRATAAERQGMGTVVERVRKRPDDDR